MEAALDSLLSDPAGGENGVEKREVEKEPSPLEKLRDLFLEKLVPAVDTINARYREKGVSITMDASDFLNGRRGVLIEIRFQVQRLRLEGTVMPDAIAFHETRFVSNLGGTVAAGPMLRTRNLNEQTFADFLYERIINLVRTANR